VIFSRINAKTGFLTDQEVKHLANFVVKEFGVNRNNAVWIEHDPSLCEEIASTAFRLVSFNWSGEQAVNPRWLPINESWYLYWLENGNLEYIKQQSRVNTKTLETAEIY